MYCAHATFVSLTGGSISKVNTSHCFDQQFLGVGSSFKGQKKRCSKRKYKEKREAHYSCSF